MPSKGKTIKAGQGGKPKVKTHSNELAGVSPAPGYPEEKPVPDEAWKSERQQAADEHLKALFPNGGQANKE